MFDDLKKFIKGFNNISSVSKVLEIYFKDKFFPISDKLIKVIASRSTPYLKSAGEILVAYSLILSKVSKRLWAKFSLNTIYFLSRVKKGSISLHSWFKGEMDEHFDTFGKKLNLVLPIAAIIIMIGTVCYWNNLRYGLVLAYEGEEIATIQNEKTFEEANALVNERLVYSNDNSEKDFSIQPKYKLAVVDSASYAEPEVLCDRLIEQSHDVIEEATGIYIDDELIGVVKNSSEADDILNCVMSSVCGDSPADEVSFVENVENIAGLYPSDSIISKEALSEKLNNVKESEEFYTVVTGDTPIGIAAKFGMNLSSLDSLNDNNVAALMKEGLKVRVKCQKNILTVQVKKQVAYDNEVPFKTVKTEDQAKYKDYSKVTQTGVNGLERCIDSVTYLNGVESSREPISREIINNAIDENLVVGIKEKCIEKGNSLNNRSKKNHTAASCLAGDGKSTGSLLWPVPYTRNVTSGFGYRWGAFHSGVDISSSGIGGKSIVAADGGVVTFVKCLRNGYGNHVEISHGNGKTTLYAHCSQIFVSAGQKVSKGQAIASVGSTGDSTGNHLHFEVCVNGAKQNPLKFV